jgi:hypothetical protein
MPPDRECPSLKILCVSESLWFYELFLIETQRLRDTERKQKISN